MYMQEILNIMILNNFDYDFHIYLMKSLDNNCNYVVQFYLNDEIIGKRTDIKLEQHSSG